MRQHAEHLAAAMGALGFALFVSYFNTGTIVRIPPPAFPTNARLSVLPADHPAFATTAPAFEFSTTSLERLFMGESATATPAPSEEATGVPATPPTPAKKTSEPSPPTPSIATTTASTTPDVNAAGELATLKDSIVNIICIAHAPPLRSISGSGVIVDSRGLILTAAHVAQMLLLESYLGSDEVSCTIRTGSPARSTYLAHVIYIPQAWLKDNPTTLISSQPTGTGEHDYALLAITSGVSGAPLPDSFPAVTLSGRSVHIGDAVALGTYGSQELSSAQIRNALYPTLVTSTVKDRFTFDTNTADVLSLAGSLASQEGSSGGAVVNDKGNLVGIITTSEITGDVASRETRAITSEYIRRSFGADSGKDFIDYFSSTQVSTLVNSYAPTVQNLGQFLAHAIGLE